jgi:transketolase
MRKENHSVIVLMSDGETNEGTTWEAAHFARQHQLDNLIVIVDKNRLQGFGNTSEVIGDTCSPEQWKALGFEVHETDGHDVNANSALISSLKSKRNGMPKVILANTVKGKGVKYMEDRLEWHYNPMNEEQYKIALEDINRLYAN